MLHGDISNQKEYTIGFRCENSLLIPKSGLHLFHTKWVTAKVNEEVMKVMKHIYWNTPYTVALVVNRTTYDSRGFKEMIEDFPFNMVYNVLDSVSEVSMWLHTGDLSYFVSDDIIDLSLVNSEYAMPVDKFLKLGYKIRRA